MFFRSHIFDGVEPNGNLLTGTVEVMVARLPPDIERGEAEIAKALSAMKYPAGLIGMNLPAIMARIEQNCTHARGVAE